MLTDIILGGILGALIAISTNLSDIAKYLNQRKKEGKE